MEVLDRWRRTHRTSSELDVYYVGPVWQGSGSSKNSSGSGSVGGVAFMVELKLFWKKVRQNSSIYLLKYKGNMK